MKKITFLSSVVFSFVLISLSSEAQVVKGGGGGGLGAARGAFASFFFPKEQKEGTCQEGTSRQFDEYDTSQDQRVYVTRLCKNGSFFEKSNIDYRKLRCKEGAVSSDVERNGDEQVTRVYRCTNGKRQLIRAY